MFISKQKIGHELTKLLKLVSYDSYNEFVPTQESTAFNVVLVHN